MAKDKEVIVTNDGGGGGGAMVALLAVVLLIAVGAFLYFGTNVFRSGSTVNADVKVEAPTTK